MKKNTLLLGLFLVICKLSFSTPQVRDVLYWNGTTYHVYPFIHVEKRFSEAQINKLNEWVKDHITTSNWRGYYFEFEICRDSLFLVSIKDDHQEDLMAFVLGSNNRIMMDDFSDTLYLGYGKSFYDPWFPTMIYESEMTVVFNNGIAGWHEDHRNKSKHAELPNNTMKWNEYIYSSIQWDALDQNILAENPKAYVNFSTDSIGKVCDVTLQKSSGYPDFDKEAIRVVAALPEFSAHFVCGKYLKNKYQQPIVFDKSKATNNERWNYKTIEIDTVTKVYYNNFIEENIFVEEITIKNRSNEDYLTWISWLPIAGLSNQDLMQSLFFSKQGDFRFFDLMYDNVVLSKYSYNIGYAFIKKIPKDETFTYVIMKKSEKSDFYGKRIVIISKKEVEDYIGRPIREEYCFPWSSVCLSGEKGF